MRGKQDQFQCAHSYPGLIPAHAGKTESTPPQPWARWAHPRACGENQISKGWGPALAGSSPRMRGKPKARSAARAPRGLIPAHAGKTIQGPRILHCPLAHPRACGENDKAGRNFSGHRGSSPRMRGKLFWSHRDVIGTGLIPAHAGKTNGMRKVQPSARAHPRACGENDHEIEDAIKEMGSSLRMRGKRCFLSSGNALSGLIPAHAGKTQKLQQG